MNILNDPPAPPRDQRVYPTRTADRCSDCPPAGYPTEKTRCYGCPLANTYKDATGELVIPTAAPSSKTDLEFVLTALRHALGGMRAVQEHAPQGTAAARYANELEQAIGIIERMRQDETSEPPHELRPLLDNGLKALDAGVPIQPTSYFHEELKRLLAMPSEEPSPVTNSSGSVSRPVDVPALAVGADQPTGAAALEAGTAHPPRVLEKDVELDLTCEEYIEDPHSRFCDRCGYPEREHKRAGSQEKASGVSTESCGCSRRADGFKVWCGKHWVERGSENGTRDV